MKTENTYWTKDQIIRALATLPRAVRAGMAGGGAPIAVRLNFTLREPTPKAREQASLARAAGFDPALYTGTLDKVFKTASNEICFTILCKERIDLKEKRYCYRTFNLDSGQVQSITA